MRLTPFMNFIRYASNYITCVFRRKPRFRGFVNDSSTLVLIRFLLTTPFGKGLFGLRYETANDFQYLGTILQLFKIIENFIDRAFAARDKRLPPGAACRKP